jgi:hypothetical protein
VIDVQNVSLNASSHSTSRISSSTSHLTRSRLFLSFSYVAVINSSSIQGQTDYNKALSTACRSHINTNASEFNVLTESHANGDVNDEVEEQGRWCRGELGREGRRSRGRWRGWRGLRGSGTV